MEWLTSARIDRARVLLETTDEAIEQLGRLTGLGAPASVRASFHSHLDTSPQAYRILFRHSRSIREHRLVDKSPRMLLASRAV
jgi:transcriptional regulator GlxA family with amidase domain